MCARTRSPYIQHMQHKLQPAILKDSCCKTVLARINLSVAYPHLYSLQSAAKYPVRQPQALAVNHRVNMIDGRMAVS